MIRHAPWIRHGFLVMGVLLLSTLGTVMVSGARSPWRIFRDGGQTVSLDLPSLPRFDAAHRLLVIAPHPDDETLGCAGLIRQAKRNGAAVSVVYLTNGDAFPVAVQRFCGKLRPGPWNYIRFGDLRRLEAINAVRQLGLPRENLYFLGYPDRGLDDLWLRNWSTAEPYLSKTTWVSRNPYPESLRPGAPYAGTSLVDDLVRVIKITRPTDIFYTHPNDDHPDHAYAGCFLLMALERLGITPTRLRFTDPPQTVNESNRSTVRLHTYLVHRGEWPAPRGFHTDAPLLPPPAMRRLDTNWRTLDLDSEDISAKTDAIRRYQSQMGIPPGGAFLHSFIRRNELFGEYRLLYETLNRPPGPRSSTPWFYIHDPVDDKVMRDIQPGADIKQISLRRSRDQLVLRLTANGRMNRWTRYRINLRSLRTDVPAIPSATQIVARLGKSKSSPDTSFLWSADTLEVRLPIRRLDNPSRVMINAEAIVGGLVVDRSALRAFSLD